MTGKTATPSQNFDRWASGPTCERTFARRWGSRRSTASSCSGRTWTAASTSPIRSLTQVDQREFGFYAGVTQEITQYGVVGFRFDYYDPNFDATRQPRRKAPSRQRGHQDATRRSWVSCSRTARGCSSSTTSSRTRSRATSPASPRTSRTTSGRCAFRCSCEPGRRSAALALAALACAGVLAGDRLRRRTELESGPDRASPGDRRRSSSPAISPASPGEQPRAGGRRQTPAALPPLSSPSCRCRSVRCLRARPARGDLRATRRATRSPSAFGFADIGTGYWVVPWAGRIRSSPASSRSTFNVELQRRRSAGPRNASRRRDRRSGQRGPQAEETICIELARAGQRARLQPGEVPPGRGRLAAVGFELRPRPARHHARRPGHQSEDDADRRALRRRLSGARPTRRASTATRCEAASPTATATGGPRLPDRAAPRATTSSTSIRSPRADRPRRASRSRSTRRRRTCPRAPRSRRSPIERRASGEPGHRRRSPGSVRRQKYQRAVRKDEPP